MRGKADAQVKAALRKIKTNPGCGKALGGALKGCQSIRVEGDRRLVYRQVEVAGQPAIEVLAISQRRDDEVYDSAEKRVAG